jgi:hypothetical protein
VPDVVKGRLAKHWSTRLCTWRLGPRSPVDESKPP